jgi:hypothetical protein
MKQGNVFVSLVVSVIIQLLTGLIGLGVLFFSVPLDLEIIKQMLVLEVVVQFVEGFFYFYWLYNFNAILNITPKRYFDWAITTPTMLITLITYLVFLEYQEKKGDEPLNFFTIFNDNVYIIVPILLLNWLMLLFGYLGEIQMIPIVWGVILGFIPFIIYYYMIYTNFAVLSEDGLKIFFYFLFFWSLYGVAALFPYRMKNTFYNILDLFAKNFFGIYLIYILVSHKL